MDPTQRRELLRLNRLNKKYSTLDKTGVYNKYVGDYIRIKMVKGKPIRWDTRTNKEADEKVIQEAVNQKLFGTSTPYKDAKYLKGLEELSIMKSRDKNDAFANLRRQFSPKTVNEGERLIDVKRQLKYENIEKNLEKLRLGTSYGRRDRADLIEETRSSLTPNESKQQDLDIDQSTEISTAIKDMPQEEQSNVNKANEFVIKVTGGSNNKVPVVKKEPEQPYLRSDVFTLDSEGNPLGVMSRSQRNKWDKENQALMIARQKGLNKPDVPKSKLKISDRTYGSGFLGSG